MTSFDEWFKATHPHFSNCTLPAKAAWNAGRLSALECLPEKEIAQKIYSDGNDIGQDQAYEYGRTHGFNACLLLVTKAIEESK